MRNKFYAGNIPGGGGLIWVSVNPPENKMKYSQWFNSGNGKMYFWFQLPTHGQWIQDVAFIDAIVPA